jgi:hypothetical protein
MPYDGWSTVLEIVAALMRTCRVVTCLRDGLEPPVDTGNIAVNS